jgi:hypothetical protein
MDDFVTASSEALDTIRAFWSDQQVTPENQAQVVAAFSTLLTASPDATAAALKEIIANHPLKDDITLFEGSGKIIVGQRSTVP